MYIFEMVGQISNKILLTSYEYTNSQNDKCPVVVYGTHNTKYCCYFIKYMCHIFGLGKIASNIRMV